MPKRQQLNLRISDEEKQMIEEDARNEARSVSNLLLWCWKQWRSTKKKVSK